MAKGFMNWFEHIPSLNLRFLSFQDVYNARMAGRGWTSTFDAGVIELYSHNEFWRDESFKP